MGNDDPLELARAWLEQIGPASLAAGGVVFLALVVLLVMLLGRRRGPPPLNYRPLAIDLDPFGDHGPPDETPTLHCHGLPVRLAVLVLAPVGRGAGVPSGIERSAAIEQIVPGLAAVAAAHNTLLKSWPPQLSSSGFAQSFFANVKLPGDRGKGTRWCSLAGKFETDSGQFMAGMALCASRNNGLSQFAIEMPGDWFDALRVQMQA